MFTFLPEVAYSQILIQRLECVSNPGNPISAPSDGHHGNSTGQIRASEGASDISLHPGQQTGRAGPGHVTTHQWEGNDGKTAVSQS